MSALRRLNKSPNGVVMGLVQLPVPVVQTPADVAAQTAKICAMVAKARRNMLVTDGSSCGFAAPTRDYQPEPSEVRKYA
jgi:hypothetical protein